jgi:hypothetical protein
MPRTATVHAVTAIGIDIGKNATSSTASRLGISNIAPVKAVGPGYL